jgi:hypothetical protein
MEKSRNAEVIGSGVVMGTIWSEMERQSLPFMRLSLFFRFMDGNRLRLPRPLTRRLKRVYLHLALSAGTNLYSQRFFS